ncbi:MAG: metallophosphoesterase [Pseudomonadota bacterium]|nr:metallophosphoesterase [Pseudomonadota bacterium]
MRTLVHLSDLHFGRTDAALIEPLLASIAVLGPDVVVVSGDLTQRARATEFAQARAFLDRLAAPRIVVPGNHDVPMYRVWERFLSPLGKYRRYIGSDLEPAFVDDEIAVLGVNTARSLTFKNGRINQAQIDSIRRRFEPLAESLTKVVVTHHPFDLPDEPGEAEVVGRAQRAMAAFATCGVDLLLAGHFHTSQAGDTSKRHPLSGYSALVVQAGTATSTRGRGESNTFNVLRVQRDAIAVERRAWHPETGAFELERTENFRREAASWRAC